jgi:Flp pilus assembly protein TadD
MKAAVFLVCFLLSGQETWTEAFKAGRFADAVSICDTRLQSEPGNVTLWTGRGLALENLGRSEEALQSFGHALGLQPSFIPALKAAAELTYRSHDPHAREFVEKLLKADPQNKTAHAMAGVLAFEAQDCGGAISHFEAAGTELTQNRQGYSLLGVCLLRLNHSAEAEHVFRILLTQNPESSNVRYDLGYSQFLSGHAIEAIESLRPLTSVDRPPADALNLIAAAEAYSGQLAAAIADLRKAVEVQPAAEEHYLDFAALCLAHGSLDIAKEIVDIGLEKIPTSARLYSMRGIIQAQHGKYEEASRDFEQANRLSPETSYGSLGLSVLRAESKQPQEAARLLREKLSRAPDDPTLNYLLADILLNQPGTTTAGDLTEAKSVLLRSIRAKPDFSSAHALLGKLYRREGDKARAIEEFKTALAHDPQNRVALNQIVTALREANRVDEAASYSRRLRRTLEQEISSDADQTRLRIVRTP